MNKKYVSKTLTIAVILALFSVSVVPSTAEVEHSSISPLYDGKTLYVGGSGPNNYTRIQDSINNTSDGDTVFVYDDSSPYYENVNVTKSICLTGENKETTVIDGGGKRSVIILKDINIKISGFTIQNSGKELGKQDSAILVLRDSAENIISNNIVKSNNVGIFLCCTIWCNVTDNIITSNKYGIIGSGMPMYGQCYENIISGNIISKNTKYGIWSPVDFYNGEISNNTITKNRIGIELTYLFHCDVQNIICIRNNISKNIIGLIAGPIGTNITQNNFIKNIRHAITKDSPRENTWDKNYWGKPRDSPYRIPGRIRMWWLPFLLPWFPAYDKNPASEPYDIGGGI